MQSVNFIGLHIRCEPEAGEILIAELSLLPFDTFEESENGISGFCPEQDFKEDEVQVIIERYQSQFDISYATEIIPKENWNQKWEENFDPVEIGDEIVIRAPFHKRFNVRFEITINPKMSFGTGHHPTTHLMLSQQLNLDHSGKSIYDFGSGTGILAIMAGKLGAEEVVATDIDEWCIENSRENFELNGLKFRSLLGPVKDLELTKPADIVLANINKNVLLSEMIHYARLLKPGGKLLVSGFYVSDVKDLEKKAHDLTLEKSNQSDRDNWACLLFVKRT